jgi:chemotaxis protein MotA
MDKATIIGLILSWASLVVSVILEELHKGKTIGDIHVAAYFLAGPAVLVFGGSFGATLIGLSGREIKELPAKLKVAFFRKTHDVEALIKQLLDFAVRARRDGILALENDIDGLGDPFMKKGFQLAIDGADLDNIHEILEQDLSKVKLWYKEGEEFCKQMGGFFPTLGVIGTVMGLISMLSNLEDAASMGPAIAAAFIATLYGVCAANIVFLPLANKIKNVGAQEIMVRKVVLEGVLSIQSGASIRITESRLRALVGEDKAGETKKGKE